MDCRKTYLSVIFLIYSVIYVGSVELQFELIENSKECFYQHIEKNVTSTLEFQVITGGQYDVDVTLESPNKEVIYKQIKAQFDSHTFVPTVSGVYKACFSNEFSTISHKIVYMDFQVGEEAPLPGVGEHVTVMTQMETTAHEIHKHMSSIIDYQTHHRLREAQSRKRADELNGHVLWWSIIETLTIISSSIIQVYVLKNFFTERNPYQRIKT